MEQSRCLCFIGQKIGLINHACKACTVAFSATDAASVLGVSIKGDLKGHSDLVEFSKSGYEIISSQGDWRRGWDLNP